MNAVELIEKMRKLAVKMKPASVIQNPVAAGLSRRAGVDPRTAYIDSVIGSIQALRVEDIEVATIAFDFYGETLDELLNVEVLDEEGLLSAGVIVMAIYLESAAKAGNSDAKRKYTLDFYKSKNVLFVRCRQYMWEFYVELLFKAGPYYRDGGLKEYVNEIRKEGSLAIENISESCRSAIAEMDEAAAKMSGRLHEDFGALKANVEAVSDTASAFLQGVQVNLDDGSNRLEGLKEKIDTYKKELEGIQGEYSIKSIASAFDRFIKEKTIQRYRLLCVLIFTGVILLFVPFAAVFLAPKMLSVDGGLYGVVKEWVLIDPVAATNAVSSSVSGDGLEGGDTGLGKQNGVASGDEEANISNKVPSEVGRVFMKIMLLLPFVVAEVFLIFYFRIFLANFTSINAQILQLRMRMALCSFIEGYDKFRVEHKDLPYDKFDALIFSNLMSDADKIPSATDGLDVLSKILHGGSDKPPKS